MRIRDVVLSESMEVGDNFDIELGNMIIESTVVGFMQDGVIVEADRKALVLIKIAEEQQSKLDTVLAGVASGKINLATLMSRPKSSDEKYAADQLWSMYSDIGRSLGVDLDNNFKKDYQRHEFTLDQKISNATGSHGS